ncbi:MAG: aminodeoxychorismate/anthranilate synthase component II [Proteobacteria bacterium]|nr:aminodeoxychorismate/anthranilate synthase component II [Pseudomonadota bacterium]
MFIDHYDSFSFNVLDWLIRAGLLASEVLHIYHDDDRSMASIEKLHVPTVFGPGPKSPMDVPQSLGLATTLLGKVPLLGVCLGHQILGNLTPQGLIRENRTMRAHSPWHGTAVGMRVLSDQAIFAGHPKIFSAACYNSLVIDPALLAADWNVSAVNDFGEIMAMEWLGAGDLAWSVQFHPESFLTESGSIIATNWLRSVGLIK